MTKFQMLDCIRNKDIQQKSTNISDSGMCKIFIFLIVGAKLRHHCSWRYLFQSGYSYTWPLKSQDILN